MVSCPECVSTVALPESMYLNEILECSDCHVELEVLALDPVMVGLAPEIEEDWGE
jgi:alpha-aminoadipate/glutamate carrier protein LysW